MPEGQSGQQTVDILQKRVEDLGAIKTGNFTVDCDTYNTVQQNSKLENGKTQCSNKSQLPDIVSLVHYHKNVDRLNECN